MLAANQGLLYVLSMVVIGGLVGAGALGYLVVAGFSQSAALREGPGGRDRHRRARDHARPNRPVRGGPLRAAPDTEETPWDDKIRDRSGWQRWRCSPGWPSPAAAAVTSSRQPTGGGGGEECGEFNIAINPWVGYEANAARRGRTSPRAELGCDVEYKNVKEEVAWQGFGNGEVDVVIENWGHDDLKKKYIDGPEDRAVEAGPTGNVGIIGWYVPPWMAEEYPTSPTGRTSTSTPTCSRPPSPATRASCSTATRRS